MHGVSHAAQAALSVEETLRRVAGGDRGALRALYDAEAPRMLGVALRILRRRALAEEAVQDAFVQVWRNAGSFDPARGTGRAFLYAVLRHRALNILRGEFEKKRGHMPVRTLLTAVGPALKAATFTWPDPGYGGEYARILGTPARFGCERNGLLIDAEWLGHQVERLPSYAFGVLTRHADGLLGELEAARSVRGEVERRLLPVLHAGAPGMRAVAAQLGVSRQTLFRRLKAEGVTFEQVLDDLRRRLALDYLAGRKVSVNETAYLVGFSEPAAFSRAFKRWTGRNPRDLRG